MVGSRERERTVHRDRHDRDRDERHGSNGWRSGTSGLRRRSVLVIDEDLKRDKESAIYEEDHYLTDNNSDDNSYDSSRRHRTQEYDRYDSDRRSHRDRRARSRSKDSRDRDRDRESTSGADNQSNRYYNEDHNSSHYDYANDSTDRDRDRDYDRSQSQRDKREDMPNNTIMIRGLAPHITEKDIVSKLSEHNLMAKDIRLMRKKETGVSRGFAFVEFTNIEDAIQWKELTQGYVYFDEECEASVHYSIPKDSFGGDKNIMKNDWMCYKCGVNNFKRREECFKCGTPKEESLANDTGDDVSLSPTNALLLRNLSANTTEERILTILGSITALPIKSIRIIKDPLYNISRGMCLVELNSTLEASQLFTLLSSMSMGFVIDDSVVQVNYGKRNATLGQINTNSNAAIVALAAAQWKNLDETHSKKTPVPSNSGRSSMSSNKLGTVCVKGVEYQKYETPNISSFQLDESSGYYYDSTTGFYYDSNTQYFYNTQIQQYVYWDDSNQTYLTVESKSETIEKEKKEKPKDVKSDKVKIAKKIAKDMEKWAKTLNQKKETARTWVPTEALNTVETVQSSSADAGFTVLEQQVSNPEPETSVFDSFQKQVMPQEVKLNADNKNHFYLSAYEIMRAEEKRLIDWEKLACLLCKRQFSTPELLNKHIQLSDLHKSNLNALKHQKLSDEQIEELERTESEAGYRDRAKERRKKYGIPETPETNKLKTKYLSELEERTSCDTTVPLHKTPISDNNIGNKMLKAMGWTEGTGLGKTNQGTKDIIEVERRTELVGLGMRANVSTATGQSYKDAVRRTMQMKFKEMHE
ncbi:unnamed protein product [Oppiella nova]|uniref:RNA-binding protein 5 n=1 Tax=Oppiella nova TaxID=334625 RepID=A0A7R9LB20_9ACAR|nr:unnamed protein product [Oppiella nova]CAG2160271.1 unnamed protein product [Oppiella nova]